MSKVAQCCSTNGRLYCDSWACFTTDHQQVAVHSDSFHLRSMCKSVAKQRANRATCNERHSFCTLVGLLRSCAHCVHSARLECRIQNTQTAVQHLKETTTYKMPTLLSGVLQSKTADTLDDREKKKCTIRDVFNLLWHIMKRPSA